MTIGLAPVDERRARWPTVVGGISFAYGLLVVLHSIARFTLAAFGPVIPGVGGDRPPIPPIELRWHIALEAVFTFALGVLLLIAASSVIRRLRQGVLMLGFWAISAITVQVIFLTWGMTIEEERSAWRIMAQQWRDHASVNGLGTAQPFGRYEDFIDWMSDFTRVALALPFIYPLLMGFVVLLPSVRRESSRWK